MGYAGRRPHRVVKGRNRVERFDLGASQQLIERIEIGALGTHRHRRRANAEADERTDRVVVGRRLDGNRVSLSREQANREGDPLARPVTQHDSIGIDHDPGLVQPLGEGLAQSPMPLTVAVQEQFGTAPVEHLVETATKVRDRIE